MKKKKNLAEKESERKLTDEEFEKMVDLFCILMITGMMGLAVLGEFALDRLYTAIDNYKAKKSDENHSVPNEQNGADLKKKAEIEKIIKNNFTYQR